jgi:hypothetical protein
VVVCTTGSAPQPAWVSEHFKVVVIAGSVATGVVVVATVATVATVGTVTTGAAVTVVVTIGTVGVVAAIRAVVGTGRLVVGVARVGAVRGVSTGTTSGTITGGVVGSGAGPVVETGSPESAEVAKGKAAGFPTLDDGLSVLTGLTGLIVLLVRAGCVRFGGTGFTVGTGTDDLTRETTVVAGGSELVVGLVALVV